MMATVLKRKRSRSSVVGGIKRGSHREWIEVSLDRSSDEEEKEVKEKDRSKQPSSSSSLSSSSPSPSSPSSSPSSPPSSPSSPPSSSSGYIQCTEKEGYPWNWVLYQDWNPHRFYEKSEIDPLNYVRPPWTPSICELVFEKLDSGELDIDLIDNDLASPYVALKVWNRMQYGRGGPQYELAKPIVSSDWIDMKKGDIYFHTNFEVKPKDDTTGDVLLLFAEVIKRKPSGRFGPSVYLASMCCPVNELPSDCSKDEINNGCLCCLLKHRIYHPSIRGFEVGNGPAYRITKWKTPDIYHPPDDGFGWDSAVYAKKKRARHGQRRQIF